MIINVAGLIQHIYFENALISKFESKDMLLWRRGFAFGFTENDRLWIQSVLTKIRFDQGRPPEKSSKIKSLSIRDSKSSQKKPDKYP